MLRINPLVLLLGVVACGDDAESGAASAGNGASVADSSDASNPGAGDFREVGVCGQRSEGTVTVDSYAAHEEFYLVGEEGFGEELCVVRFEVTRVGDAPAGCDESAGQQQECLWTHLVRYDNPSVVTDRDGACANSELALTAAAIAEIEERQVAYGYEYIWAEQSRVGSQGRVIKMTLDREYFEVIELPGLADAIDVTDDGSLLYDVGNSGELREMTRDGEVRTIWHCGSELDLEPNCYSNTINWNPIEDSVFMSFPEPGAVVEIDRASGEMIGYFGNQPDAWAFAPPLENPPVEWGFGFQHFPNISPTGTLMVSSHMPGYEAFNTQPTPNQHAFIEFAIDRENQTLTEVWRYTEGPEWPRSRGMAIRLASGNTLGNYGTAGVIREITPDKETVFHVKFDIPAGNDAYNKLVGNNVLIDDLYALNGGLSHTCVADSCRSRR